MEEILMSDLESILEAVRISFAQHEILSWATNYKKIDRDSDKIYPTWINFEIVGAYIQKNKIKVIASLKEFSFSEEIYKRVLREFEDEVINIVTERIPESIDKIEIIFEFKQKMLQLSY
jgi:hypothetical protein